MPKTISEDELVGRKDLRENYRVWISIADVSHYIKEGSYLDKEAEKRRKQHLSYRHCYTNVTIPAFK